MNNDRSFDNKDRALHNTIDNVRYNTLLVRNPWTCENPGKVGPFFMKFLPQMEREKL